MWGYYEIPHTIDKNKVQLDQGLKSEKQNFNFNLNGQNSSKNCAKDMSRHFTEKDI